MRIKRLFSDLLVGESFVMPEDQNKWLVKTAQNTASVKLDNRAYSGSDIVLTNQTKLHDRVGELRTLLREVAGKSMAVDTELEKLQGAELEEKAGAV